MILLDGKMVANSRNEILKNEILEASKKVGREPSLAIILIGNNGASLSYVNNKIKTCKEVLINASLYHLNDDVSESEVIELINKLNSDDLIDGIILQLPLPNHLDKDKLTNLILPSKDSDGFVYLNQGKLYQGNPFIIPATPRGIMVLLDEYNIELKGKNAVVVGMSNIVGFPISRLLLDRGATVTTCHILTKDLKAHTKLADILVVATGVPKLIKKDMVKENAVVIDVGTTKVETKLVGDVDFDEVKEIVSYITPVPKGIGPMTINSLLENTFQLFKEKFGKSHNFKK